mmetsp:Transcript_37968/g.108869  ORF Transcript_37968/g.108869 Transcript_37968/m.108869 type:complete len:345 (+) Transcript_37968:196-1230(+)
MPLSRSRERDVGPAPRSNRTFQLWPCPELYSRMLAHVVANARNAGLLSWGGKLDALSILEDDRLEIIGDREMHDRAGAVALDVRLEALVWAAPAHEADLPARKVPIRVPIEGVPKPGHNAGRDQVDECIAEGGMCAEVDGKVDEVILSSEALAVHHREQHVPGVVVRQVSEHHCRALLELHIRHVVVVQHATLCIHPPLHVRRDLCIREGTATHPHLIRLLRHPLLVTLPGHALGEHSRGSHGHGAPSRLRGYLRRHGEDPNHALLCDGHLASFRWLRHTAALGVVVRDSVSKRHGRWDLRRAARLHAALLPQPLVLRGQSGVLGRQPLQIAHTVPNGSRAATT